MVMGRCWQGKGAWLDGLGDEVCAVREERDLWAFEGDVLERIEECGGYRVIITVVIVRGCKTRGFERWMDARNEWIDEIKMALVG